MIREVGLRRNDDSDTSSFGFNYCAEVLGARVFTQPGSKPEVQRGSRNVRSWVKSRRNQRDNGHWPADVASSDLPVPGLHP